MATCTTVFEAPQAYVHIFTDRDFAFPVSVGGKIENSVEATNSKELPGGKSYAQDIAQVRTGGPVADQSKYYIRYIPRGPFPRGNLLLVLGARKDIEKSPLILCVTGGFPGLKLLLLPPTERRLLSITPPRRATLL
jgi:hypothetical protein